MNKPKRSVYLPTVKRVYNDKSYVSRLLRHTYCAGGPPEQHVPPADNGQTCTQPVYPPPEQASRPFYGARP